MCIRDRGNTVQLMSHLGRALCDTDTVRSRPKTNFQEKVLDYIQNNLAHKDVYKRQVEYAK